VSKTEDKSAGMNKGQQFTRQVNNSIYDLYLKLESEDGEFWCECGNMHCEERVILTLREYATLQERSGVLLSRAHALVNQPATYE
jgi:hypothetical protein